MGYKYPSLRTTLPRAGYYARLDAGAAASDQFTADGTQDGTLTNGATRVDDGGLAYSFDGVNDVVRTTATPVYPFMVAAWCKPSSIQFAYVLGFFASGSNTPHLGITITSGGKVALLAESASSGGQKEIVSSVSYTAGTWVHIAAVFASSTSRELFVNGASQGTSTVSVLIDVGVNRFSFGLMDRLTNAIPFSGTIDDVVRYGIAPAAAEIAFLASQRGAIYALASAGGGPINSQSLIRPAGDYRPQQLIVR